MRVTLLMLCFNEREGMKAVLPRIRKEWVDEIIIMDGGSTDGSIEYARSLGFPIRVQKKVGPAIGFRGQAILDGFGQALEEATGDYILSFTPDNNCVPEKIPDLIAKAKEGYEMVIASRYLKGARSYDDDFLTGFGNWFFTTLVNVLFGSRYTDVLGFYRIYRKDLLTRLKIPIKLSLSTILCIRCRKKNLRTVDIPADEPARIGGKSSRSILRNGWIELTTILGEFGMNGRG